MLTKRRLRFSVGAMLVLMTIVAVLLNREVQRANAIRTTKKSIEDWNGQVFFRNRANTPAFLTEVLPLYWTAEIVGIDIPSYKHDNPSIYDQGRYTVIHPPDFERVVELGTLDKLQFASFSGPAIRYEYIKRVCEVNSMRECDMFGLSLTAEEFESLKQEYPSITFQMPSRFLE